MNVNLNVTLANVQLDCHLSSTVIERQTKYECKVSCACLSCIFTYMNVNLVNIDLCECQTGLSFEFYFDMNVKPKINLR